MTTPILADDPRLLDSQPALPPASSATTNTLSEEQVGQWRSQGYALVSGVFPDELIAQLAADASAKFPAPDSAAAHDISDFGSNGGFVFPSASHAFNAVTLHPRFLAAVAQLLGVAVPQLRLTQSDLWPKYGKAEQARGKFDNQDQRIHVDYPNHLLAHPTPWHRPEAIEAILYLSEFSECSGPTAIVPRSGDGDPAYPWPIVDSPGIAELDYVNDRASAESYMRNARPAAIALRERLYERERYVRYHPGAVLFYRHDAWHRGTPLAPGALRLAQNLSYRKAECEWISTLHIGWAWSMYERDKTLPRLLAEASLDQRAVLGFPQPGSSYWCEQTIAAVAARFAPYGMDMTPYRAALVAD